MITVLVKLANKIFCENFSFKLFFFDIHTLVQQNLLFFIFHANFMLDGESVNKKIIIPLTKSLAMQILSQLTKVVWIA